MKSWQKTIVLSVGILGGVALIYWAGSQFLTQSTREVTFEEFEEYNTATSSLETTGATTLKYAAPDFELATVHDERIGLDSFQGKNVIIVFWTTWSPTAQDQIGILESYYEKIRDRDDVALLTINSQEDRSVVSSFLSRGEYQLPVLIDSEGKTGESYAISILPAFYFIDKNGMVQDAYIGLLSESEIDERVAKLRVD